MPDYSKEQLQELYESLPKQLQEAIFSEENGNNISKACERNGIKENDEIEKVIKYVGHVLLGLLSPDDFQKKIQRELEIEEGIAKQITVEINRLVFYPVRDSLERLYDIIINSEEKKESIIPKGADSYREPIE